jgi:hypothetical protein
MRSAGATRDRHPSDAAEPATPQRTGWAPAHSGPDGGHGAESSGDVKPSKSPVLDRGRRPSAYVPAQRIGRGSPQQRPRRRPPRRRDIRTGNAAGRMRTSAAADGRAIGKSRLFVDLLAHEVRVALGVVGRLPPRRAGAVRRLPAATRPDQQVVDVGLGDDVGVRRRRVGAERRPGPDHVRHEREAGDGKACRQAISTGRGSTHKSDKARNQEDDTASAVLPDQQTEQRRGPASDTAERRRDDPCELRRRHQHGAGDAPDPPAVPQPPQPPRAATGDPTRSRAGHSAKPQVPGAPTTCSRGPDRAKTGPPASTQSTTSRIPRAPQACPRQPRRPDRPPTWQNTQKAKKHRKTRRPPPGGRAGVAGTVRLWGGRAGPVFPRKS